MLALDRGSAMWVDRGVSAPRDHRDHDDFVNCQCAGGAPKNFLRACLLLLLSERPGHGYDLVERLRDFGIEKEPGGVYRALRALEREGLLYSAWETSSAGPARRGYELTWEGEETLAEWSATLATTRRLLDHYLGRFEDAKKVRS
jgi:poly-beta-hydroxybutyrate-responsive repressor